MEEMPLFGPERWWFLFLELSQRPFFILRSPNFGRKNPRNFGEALSFFGDHVILTKKLLSVI